MSSLLIKCLLIEYLGIAVVCAFEHKWPMMLYWVSAGGLQVAILWGMK